MNPKNTWMLLLFAGGLFAFIFFFERHLHPPEPVVARVLPDLRAGDVVGLKIEPAGQDEIRVQRTTNGWQLVTRQFVCPAETLPVENLLHTLENLTAQARIGAEQLQGRLNMNEEFGFAHPQATVIVETAGHQRQLNLGLLTPPGDQIYAQVVGLEGIDIIDADFFKKILPHQANDWRETAFARVARVGFDRLTVNVGQKSFELERARPAHSTNLVWRMTRPLLARADNPKINDLVRQFEDVNIRKFVTDNPKADLESFGLQPPELEMVFTHGTNRLLSFQFGKSPTNDSTVIYARRDGESSVVLVPAAPLAPWRADSQEFRDRHLARLPAGGPDLIEAAGPEKFTVQRQADGSWRVTQPVAWPADTNVMRAFIANLAGLLVAPVNGQFAVKDVVPESDLGTNYGLLPPAQKYVLKRQTESGTNAILAELDFGREKDGIIYARRGDLPEESSVFGVSTKDFRQLPATSLDLRARRVWNFSAAEVSRLIIRQQDGRPMILVHKTTNEWNIAPGSQGTFNNPVAVEIGVEELGELEAAAWVGHGAAELARCGFSETGPQISVAVKSQGREKILALNFGGVSPRKLRYAATQMDDGEDWVFEFPADSLDRLTAYFDLK